jgi:hypothetical protein
MRGDLALAQQLLMALIQQRMSGTLMPHRQGLSEADAAEALDRRIGHSAEEYFAAARERRDLQAVLRLLWWPPVRTGGDDALQPLRARILRSGTESMVALILASGEAGHHVQVLDLMREQSARAAQPPAWIEDLMGQVERRLAELDPVSTSSDVAIRFAHHLLTRRLGGVENPRWFDDEILVLLRGCVQAALGDALPARSDVLSFVSRFAQEIRAQGQADPALLALYDQVLAEGARVALGSRDHYAVTQMETLLRERVESQEPVSPELSALYEAVDRGGTP